VSPVSAAGRRRSFWRELPVLLVVAVLIAVLIRSFVVQTFYIPSGSMEPTLVPPDRVLVNKLVYRFRPILRGQVVVFVAPVSWRQPGERDFVKRVVGLPGDTVACCDPRGRVTVDGQPLDEPYLYPGNPPSQITFSVTVPAGRLFVLGDHRTVSADSRRHLQDNRGTIPISSVIGQAFVVIWPVDQWRTLPVPATFRALNSARP